MLSVLIVAALAAWSSLATAQNLTGDSHCLSLICVSAIVNRNGTVTYIMQNQVDSPKPGWMAVGFGQRMNESPMVIMWSNPDGTVSLSQRITTDYNTPKVDPNPPRQATISEELSITNQTHVRFAFMITALAEAEEDIIWAFSDAQPSSPDPSAAIQQHLVAGSTPLNLTALNGSFTPGLIGTDETGGPTVTPPPRQMSTKTYQKIIIAHAILMALGFLVFLPTGILVARLLRLIAPKSWFRIHAVNQFWIAAPIITVAFVLGLTAANNGHLNDTHKRLGVAVYILYCFQSFLGAYIHFARDRKRKQRPPQNYAHGFVGVTILLLSFYQLYNGFKHEWPAWSGLGRFPKSVDVIFWLWVVGLSIAYGSGLLLLPKQFKSEEEQRKKRKRSRKR